MGLCEFKNSDGFPTFKRYSDGCKSCFTLNGMVKCAKCGEDYTEEKEIDPNGGPEYMKCVRRRCPADKPLSFSSHLTTEACVNAE